MKQFVLYLLASSIFLFSCKSNTSIEGDSVVNYPNLENIYNEQLARYETDTVLVYKIVQLGTTKDSTYTTTNKLQWEPIKQYFVDANFSKVAFDKKYKMDVLTEPYTDVITYLFTPLDKNVYTKTLSIKSNQSTSILSSIYFERNERGFFSKKNIKLLYAVGKTLQIQEYTKKPFQKETRTITTYNFTN